MGPAPKLLSINNQANMKMLLISIIVIVLIAIAGFVALRGTQDEVSDQAGSEAVTDDAASDAVSEKLDKAPEFSLEDYDGNTVALSDHSGKVRVVNSWAVWCPFCVDELSDFARLQEEFGDEIVVIAIDRQESLKKARDFTDSLGITDRMTFLLDPDDSFYKSIGGFSMPETIFVDSDGNIRFHKRGPMPLEEMREKVNQIINS